jgi:hypothetical protein
MSSVCCRDIRSRWIDIMNIAMGDSSASIRPSLRVFNIQPGYLVSFGWTMVNYWLRERQALVFDRSVNRNRSDRCTSVITCSLNNHLDELISYLDDAAPAGGRPHCLQDDGIVVLAGEDDSAPPPRPGRSRRDDLRSSIIAQTVPIMLLLRHLLNRSPSSSFRLGNHKMLRIASE